MNIIRIVMQSLFLLMLCLVPTTVVADGHDNTTRNEMVVFDFQKSDTLNDWRTVNDGVMGGLSLGEFVIGDSNTAVFQGTVSLENNGGFSSTRTSPRLFNVAGFDGMLLRLKGDGKRYQFRLRVDERFDGIAYRYPFKTDDNKWIIIRVPFGECVPVFRGRVLNDVAPISPARIQQIGFLISDKQAGSFRLEIDWIKAYKE